MKEEPNIVPVAPSLATSPFDAIRKQRPDGSEYWSARELMKLLGYATWENFADTIDKARVSCSNTQQNPDLHFFRDATKVSGKRGPASENWLLSRHACNLIAMNGDGRKPQIAAAQAYFSVQTLRAEKLLPPLAVPVAPPVPRPIAERLLRSVGQHRIYLSTNFGPGYWSVPSVVELEVILIEDAFLQEQLRLNRHDAPDGSIGLCWSHFRQGKPWAGAVGQVKFYRSDLLIWVNPNVYGPAEYPYFADWLNMHYLPEKLPTYAQRKFPQKSYGLAGYRAADLACHNTTGRHACLPSRARRLIESQTPNGLLPFGEDPNAAQ